MLPCASGGMVLGGGRGQGFRTRSWFLPSSFPERPRPATVSVTIPNMGIAHVLSLGLRIVDSPAPGALVLDLATRNHELADWDNHQF